MRANRQTPTRRASIRTLPQRDIVVIGASAGGIRALRDLVSDLPADFRAAILVVVHVAPDSPALLAGILSDAGALPADAAENGMPVQPGRIVVAPPDQHLMLDDGVVRLTRGPRENAHRPSIDVLFRSAAVAHGPRVIGVVLSGMLDDGAAGLWAIKRRGGTAIVQDPEEAEYPDLPRNAIDATPIDFCGPVRAIAERLAQLAGETLPDALESVPPAMAYEVHMATAVESNMDELDRIGRRTPFTCPECGGAIWELTDTGKPRFRCHVGHAYSMHTFAAQQSTRVEAALWAALRELEEKERLARQLAAEAGSRGRPRSAAIHHENAAESAAHAEVLRQMLTGQESDPAHESDPARAEPSDSPTSS